MDEKQIAYYSHIEFENKLIYFAVTEKGLCFVGSFNKGFHEMENWFNQKRNKVELMENDAYTSEYASLLKAYLKSEIQTFDVPLDVNGTEFQTAVWKALQEIPYGETKSYTDIAEKIGKPRSVRAIGAAIGANPILIVVPCHRVIGKNGKMTGYRGGLEMKGRLIDLETGISKNGTA